jgi:hypothetical protein
MTSSNDDFTKMVMGLTSETKQAFKPYARHDVDGDCVEFVFLPHAYRGERIDERVTAFYSIENGALMGSLVKGVGQLLKRNPGWLIDLEDGEFRVSQLIRAAEAVKETSPELIRITYRKLVDLAEKAGVRAETHEAHA